MMKRFQLPKSRKIYVYDQASGKMVEKPKPDSNVIEKLCMHRWSEPYDETTHCVWCGLKPTGWLLSPDGKTQTPLPFQGVPRTVDQMERDFLDFLRSQEKVVS